MTIAIYTSSYKSSLLLGLQLNLLPLMYIYELNNLIKSLKTLTENFVINSFISFNARSGSI